MIHRPLSTDARVRLWQVKMIVERLLQIHMAALAALATLMLGRGQASNLLPTLMIIAAISSVIFTDVLGWFRLHRLVANLAMLFAAFFSLSDFFRSDSHQQLLAIANLLIYVQIVLLFQQKNFRIYGQLAVFSLLQVVVAALLSDGFDFGVMLVLYMMIGFFALALFFIHREIDRFATEPPPTRVPSQGSNDGPAVWRALLGGRPVAYSLISREDSSALIGWRFARQILGMGLITLAFTVVFFYSTPRSSGTNWKQGGMGRQNLVGFAPEVSFDEMGEILTNNEPVMRVTFHDPITEEPYVVIGEPYFRGAVLVQYLQKTSDSRWKFDVGAATSRRLPSAPAVANVRQEVFLEPTNEPTLFSVFPVYSTRETPQDIRFQPTRGQIYRQELREGVPRKEFRYAVATTGLRFGSQVPIMPHETRPENDKEKKEILRKIQTGATSFILDKKRLQGLAALAQQIIEEQVPNGTTVEKARALESHFLAPGEYRYTLDFRDVQRNPRLDPIEDFVTNHRAGHCEYFASALVLMLRSQGIPARLVIGYRGGEFNYVGNYFLVRQKHAHAWVEAYLTRDEIPANTLRDAELHDGGGWLRLDPTPASEQETEAAGRNLLDRLSKSFDYAQWLWDDYVLQLTPERQRSALGQPFSNPQPFRIRDLLDPEFWQRIQDRLFGQSSEDRAQWFSWRAGLAAFVACCLVIAAVRILRLALARLRLSFQSDGNAKARREVPRIDFYERLESLLDSVGIRRQPNQTQREFAAAAADALTAITPNGAATLPVSIVRDFYRARFGQWKPEDEESQRISQALDELQQALEQAESKEP